MVLVQHELKNAYIWEYDFAKYQEVEYIQSSGTQRIDTLFTPTNNTKVEISMWWWSDNWSYPAMFWCYDTWSTTAAVAKWIFLNRNVGSNWYWYMFWWAYNGVTFSFANWQNHTYSVSQSWVIQDWTLLYTPTTVTFTGVKPISIFSLNTQANGITDYSIFKLYYCKIYESWTLVRDFIPCYRKSDNVIWLYDLVNSVFYTNSGTGTFTKWPDVN